MNCLLKHLQNDQPLEELQFNSLRACVVYGLAHFNKDEHKHTASFNGAYDALKKRKAKQFMLGVSTKRVMYVLLNK